MFRCNYSFKGIKQKVKDSLSPMKFTEYPTLAKFKISTKIIQNLLILVLLKILKWHEHFNIKPQIKLKILQISFHQVSLSSSRNRYKEKRKIEERKITIKDHK